MDCLAESDFAGTYRFGGEERQVAELEREVDLGIEQQVTHRNTLETRRLSHCEDWAREVMSGGVTKVMPRCVKKSPQE